MPRLADDGEGVRRFFDAWTGTANRGEWGAFAELLTADVVYSDPMSPEPAHGRQAVIERARAQYTSFPDGRTDLVGDPFVSVSRDALAYRWVFTGTFSMPIDPPGFAPTGARVQIGGMSMLELEEDRVRRLTLLFDSTAVARQIGAAPPPGHATERLAVLIQRIKARRMRN